MRRGIQFGDELRDNETKTKNNKSDFVDASGYLNYQKEADFRGLLFACYQSSIDDGFEFMQECKYRTDSISLVLITHSLV